MIPRPWQVRRVLATWLRPLAIRQTMQAIPGYLRFLASWRRYRSLPGSEVLRFRDGFPMLFDASGHTGLDAHYFFQGIWAARKIQSHEPAMHVDVGSLVLYMGIVSTTTPVVFVDIRPVFVDLANFFSVSGSVLRLPFANRAVNSLSCLHVAEHVGLGRYGDPLDPRGTESALRELARVLATGGDLYLSLPVGRRRVCFNAHRILDPHDPVEALSGLDLVDFSAVDDGGNFRPAAAPQDFVTARYACGMYHFRRAPGAES